jgi:hypothetical protein
MIRAIMHIAGQTWSDLPNDAFSLADPAGHGRTSAYWVDRIRDAANPAEAAREFLAALKTELQKQRSPAEMITGLQASPLWAQALDLVVPGNDRKRVRDTMQAWVAHGLPIPEMPEGRQKPLRLDTTLDEEEHHPTGVALGFGTVH